MPPPARGKTHPSVPLHQLRQHLGDRVLPGRYRPPFEEELDILTQLLNRLVSLPTVLGHGLHDHGREFFRDVAARSALLGRGHIPVRDVQQDLVDCVALDGAFERQDFIEDRAQRVDVGPMVDQFLLPLRLLRRHVGRRSRDLTIYG